MATKKTQEEFYEEVQQLQERSIELFPAVQSYQGTHYKYNWKCNIDNTQWDSPYVRIMRGHGCPTCGEASRATQNTVTLEQFFQRLKDRNCQYPMIEYVSGYEGMTKSATFLCAKCSHTWKTLPKTVVRGSGCPKCKAVASAERHSYSHDQAVKMLIDRNSTMQQPAIYIDADQTYKGSSTKIRFRCTNDHTWYARPGDTWNSDTGCPHCAGVVKRGAHAALVEIQEKWPLLTIASMHGDLLGRRELIETICEDGHKWDTTYERLMAGHYCPHCNGNAKYNQTTFKIKMQHTNPDIIILGQYVQSHIPLDVQCLICKHKWKPRPYNLIQGYGCPCCSRNNKFSKKALLWLRFVELMHDIEIQHAQKYGEFRVPGTKYRVDGYNPLTKTIYEFYGDYWHGNPQIYDPCDYNQHLNKSYNQLYQATNDREAALTQLGYNVVSIWESDFDALLSSTFLLNVIKYINVNHYKLTQSTQRTIIAESDNVRLIVINVAIPPEIDYRRNTIDLLNNKTKQTFVLFSDELESRPTLINHKLNHYQHNNTVDRIHARECEIKIVSSKERNALLNANHVQGGDNAQVAYGAYYNNLLVAVMTFSAPRLGIGVHTNKTGGEWELVRFCTDTNYRIPGIASKLLTHFKRNHQWSEIYSYADKRWSVGNMYYQLGFELVADNPPDYFYVINGKRKHRWNYRKDIIKNTLEHYDPTLTEYQNMVNHGFWRVWDCGTLKFSIINTAV